jgi:hypothetical protein
MKDLRDCKLYVVLFTFIVKLTIPDFHGVPPQFFSAITPGPQRKAGYGLALFVALASAKIGTSNFFDGGTERSQSELAACGLLSVCPP